ncbi:MAG: hypothetical protein ABI467_24535 [Kofleriaceae bacterium]
MLRSRSSRRTWSVEFYTLARSSDGAYHLVERRALAAIAPLPGFALEFDHVEDDQG